MGRTVIRWVVLCVLLASATLPPSALGEATSPGSVVSGAPAPLFDCVDLDGNRVSLEDLVLREGKVVLLNFWGIRCSSCIEEIGHLNPLSGKYARKGIVFLGVNVDGVGPEIIRKMMPQMPNAPAYTVLPDPELRIFDLYQLQAAPLSIVIGRGGRITYRHEDFKQGDEKDLERALKEAIGEAE